MTITDFIELCFAAERHYREKEICIGCPAEEKCYDVAKMGHHVCQVPRLLKWYDVETA